MDIRNRKSKEDRRAVVDLMTAAAEDCGGSSGDRLSLRKALAYSTSKMMTRLQVFVCVKCFMWCQ